MELFPQIVIVNGLVEGKIYRKPWISNEIWDFPVIVPLNQSIDIEVSFSCLDYLLPPILAPEIIG